MLVKLTISSLPLHQHLHLSKFMIIIMTLMCKMEKNYLTIFSSKHTNSPFMGASDIGQESAYTCKLQELLTGTSPRPSSLCNSRGSTQITRYLFLRNNIQNMFSSQKTSEKHPIQVQGVPQQGNIQPYPTDGFFSGTFSG